MSAARFLSCPGAITASPGRGDVLHSGLSGARPLRWKSIFTEGTKKKSSVGRQQQQRLKCTLQVDTVSGETAVAVPEVEGYAVSYRQRTAGGHDDEGSGAVGKGWSDAEGNQNERWLAKFRGLAVIAADRVETHKILAVQRNNWNHLFHQTIVIASVSAATAAAINGAEPGPGLTLVASSLNLICAAFMALVNNFQPSQLAEEQRRAARFFRRLGKEITSTLEVDPAMREEASKCWEEKVGTLYTLDRTFPLPLSPGGLEKFPRNVVPAELSPSASPDDPVAEEKNLSSTHISNCLGWTHETEDYLRKIMERIHTRDIPNQISWAEKAKRLNLVMARVSPFLAIAGAVLSIANGLPGQPLAHVSWMAAAVTVGAVFTHSVSHALQLGSAFELYRNYAGYYADIERAIERALRLPAHQREDWELFMKRINLRLGHNPNKENVSHNEHNAGKLF